MLQRQRRESGNALGARTSVNGVRSLLEQPMGRRRKFLWLEVGETALTHAQAAGGHPLLCLPF